MSYTFTQNTTTAVPGGVVAGTSQVSADGTSTLNTLLGASSTNVHYEVAGFVAVNIKSLVLFCPVAADIYTNAASGGDFGDHISLLAGVAVVWDVHSVFACPFTVDVTDGFYITNTAAGQLQVAILFDPV